MNRVRVIGAGFSGLTVAYYLRELGIEVEVFEKSQRAGGLISTGHTEHGRFEAAANGILASRKVEDLAQALKIELVPSLPQARRRYIYHGKLQRWPLGVFSSAAFAVRLLKLLRFKKSQPKAYETLESWTCETLGEPFYVRVLSVALRGIYAGDASRLSASLIVSPLLNSRVAKGKLRGTVAPKEGMGQWISALEKHLVAKGVQIHYGTQVNLTESPEGPVVVATDAASAGQVLKKVAPKIAALLTSVETVPLVTATLFFEPLAHTARPKGFGVLFSEQSFLGVLGVVLNDWIFPCSSAQWSERWIIGGALDRDVCLLSNDQIQERILNARSQVFALEQKPLAVHIHRWPRAIPHYTVDLERILHELTPTKNIYFAGNYLGGIGLTRLLERSYEVAQKIFAEVKKS